MGTPRAVQQLVYKTKLHVLHFLLRCLLLLGLFRWAKDGFLLNKAYTADRSHISPEAATMNGYKSLPGSISLT